MVKPPPKNQYDGADEWEYWHRKEHERLAPLPEKMAAHDVYVRQAGAIAGLIAGAIVTIGVQVVLWAYSRITS